MKKIASIILSVAMLATVIALPTTVLAQGPDADPSSVVQPAESEEDLEEEPEEESNPDAEDEQPDEEEEPKQEAPDVEPDGTENLDPDEIDNETTGEEKDTVTSGGKARPVARSGEEDADEEETEEEEDEEEDLLDALEAPVRTKVDDGVFDASDVSVQLFTMISELFPAMGDYDAMKDKLSKLYDLGYRNMEPFAFAFGLTAEQWLQLEKDTGLNISSWHMNPSSNADPDARAAENAEWAQFAADIGLDEVFVAMSGVTTRAQGDTYLANLEEFRDAMSEKGITLSFHTHDHEFQQNAADDGQLLDVNFLDEIFEVLDIQGTKAHLELDVHWAARAGLDPVDTIYKYADRITYLHVKDLSLLDRNTFVYEELGQGTLNMPAILKAGREIGVLYYVVEQDGDHMAGGPLESLGVTFAYLERFFGSDINNADLYPARLTAANPVIQPEQLSVQLYSVRSRLPNSINGNKDAIQAVLQQIADIGYKNVEMYNFHGLTGAEWRDILDETGLEVSSIHQSNISNEAQIATLVDNLKAIGLEHVFVPNGSFSTYGAGTTLDSIDAFRTRMAQDNIAVNYHTHNQEYAQQTNADGTMGQRIILDEIIDQGAKIELDTHWAARAGRSPVDLITKYKDEVSYLHIKDIGLAWGQSFVYEEIGYGTFDFDAIVAAGNAAGVEYYVVEQDGNYLGGDAMASIKMSYDYIAENYFPVAANGVALNRAGLALAAGEEATLTATVSPAEATNKAVTWASDDPAVATVDENGVVTGLAAGRAKITATTVDGDKTAACEVTVVAVPLRTPKTAGASFGADDVSIQLYSIRNQLVSNNYDAMKAKLEELAAIGYQNMEPFANMYGLTAGEWLQLEAETGLNISSWHMNISQLADREARLAANEVWARFAENLGLKEVFVAYAGQTTRAAADTFLAQLVDFRDVMKGHGIVVNFHTHNHEFQQDAAEDGQLVVSPIYLDELLETLDIPAGDADIPAGHTAKLELDVHWAARAGRDPVATIYEYADRITYLHMKDLSLQSRNSFVYEELGEGTLDLPGIIKAGREIGVLYYVVEQDGNYLNGNPMESVEVSFNYLDGFFGTSLVSGAYPRVAGSAKPTIDPSQLSVQFYTARSIISNNYDTVKATLQAIRDIGFENVELYNFHGLNADQWKEILAEVDINVSSLHQNVLTDEAAIQTLVENLEAVELDSIFIANGSFSDYDTSAAALAAIDAFRSRLAQDGISVNYHTHNQEFAQQVNPDGTMNSRTVLDDIIADGAKIELDVHWAARAGRTPADLIRQYADDVTFLHIKDLGYTWGETFVYEEIGYGTLDMDAIIAAGNAAGVEYYVVEQDGNHLGGDPLASLQMTYDSIAASYFPVAVSGVSLNQSTLSLEVGKQSTLTATITPADATNPGVTWASSNPAVATVADGVVSAIGAGTATITVTTEDGNFTAQCAVTVVAASVPDPDPGDGGTTSGGGTTPPTTSPGGGTGSSTSSSSAGGGTGGSGGSGGSAVANTGDNADYTIFLLVAILAAGAAAAFVVVKKKLAGK